LLVVVHPYAAFAAWGLALLVLLQELLLIVVLPLIALIVAWNRWRSKHRS